MKCSPSQSRTKGETAARSSATAVVVPARFLFVACLLVALHGHCGMIGASFPTCSIAANCSGHASTVVNLTVDNSVCNCTCVDQWSGTSCGQCPVRFNQTSCNSCAASYNQSAYPTCSNVSRACTVADDCNPSFTRFASGTTSTGCICTCRGQAIAPRCDCPSRFEQNPSASCNQCAFGYNQTTFPQCLKLCNLTVDCPPRTVSVSGNVETGCKCVCLGGWTGSQCDVCPPSWDEGSGCVTCAAGFSKINGTCITCGAANCTFHGTPIPSDTSCSCQCRNKWTGGNCEVCPIDYDADNDCSGCNVLYGYRDVNGICVPPCNSFENCTNHASDPVLLNLTTRNCDCVCRNKWNDSTCSNCPYPFDGTQDCGDCLPGLHNFPVCNNVTTTVAPTTTTLPPSTTTLPPSSSTTTAPTTTVAPTTMPPVAKNTTTHSLTASASLVPTMSVGVPSRSNSTSATVNSVTASATPSLSLGVTLSQATSTPSANTSVSQSASTSQRTKTANRSVSGTLTMSHTLSRTHSASVSKSLTSSLCANTIGDCIVRTNNSIIDEPPRNCFCTCRNQWSEMFCNYCHPRYNTSADCGACHVGLDRVFVIYPRCDYILYVSGNLTVPLIDTSLEHALVRDQYFEAIAYDVTRFANTTLQCHLWASNISAYVIAWRGGNNFAIDIEILDQDVDNATLAGMCIVDGLKNNLQDLNFSAAAALAVQLGATPANQAAPNAFFDLDNTRVQLDNSSATQWNPCDPFWCHTIPPIRDPEDPDLTWVIALCSALGAILLCAAAFYFVWHRPREQFRRQFPFRRGADVDFRRIRDVDGLEMEWCNFMDDDALVKPMSGGAPEPSQPLPHNVPSKSEAPDVAQDDTNGVVVDATHPINHEEVVDLHKEMMDSI